MSYLCKITILFCNWQNYFTPPLQPLAPLTPPPMAKILESKLVVLVSCWRLRLNASRTRRSMSSVNQPRPLPRDRMRAARYGVDFVDVYFARCRHRSSHLLGLHRGSQERGKFHRRGAECVWFHLRAGRPEFVFRSLHASFVLATAHVFLSVVKKVAAFDRFFENGCLIFVGIAKNRAVDFLKVAYHFFRQ